MSRRRRRRLLPAVDAQVLMSSLATFVAGLPSVLQNRGVADAAGGSGDSLRSAGICLFILLLALHNIYLHTLGTVGNIFYHYCACRPYLTAAAMEHHRR